MALTRTEAPVATSRGKLGKEAKDQSQGPITRGPHWVRAPYPVCPVTSSGKCPQRLVPHLGPSSYSHSIDLSPFGDAPERPKASELILLLSIAPALYHVGLGD